MTTIEQSLAAMRTEAGRAAASRPEQAVQPTPGPDAAPRTRDASSWVVRYLPAEVAATASMVIGGLLATMWTDVPALIAVAAVAGELLGFVVVSAISIYIEQTQDAMTPAHAVKRTGAVLAAGFGPVDILLALLVRPVALTIGVWLIHDPLWGPLAGKVAADLALAAVAAARLPAAARRGARTAGAGDAEPDDAP